MRIGKQIGKYSENESKKYLKKAVPYLLIYAFLFLTGLDYLPFYINFGKYTSAINFIGGMVFMYGIMQFLVPFDHWRSGRRGERRVERNLSDKLSDEYSLYNDVLLKGERSGNIDHIVVGPTGIFVIETKNNGGTINYGSYGWKGLGDSRNPISQVNNNMFRVKKVFDKNLYVESIVVFSNSKAKLEIKSEPKCNCRILQLTSAIDPSLADLIKNSPVRFSDQETKEIEQCLEESIGNWKET